MQPRSQRMAHEREPQQPRDAMRLWPGKPYPLGATWDGSGVNFALFSEHATAVELCLFEGEEGHQQAVQLPLREQTDQVWHVYLPQVRPGQLYGYRVHGPYEPKVGHRFNPAKLLLDPYAKAITGDIRWSDASFGYTIGHPDADLSRDERDSSGDMPRCVVVDTAFSWGDDKPLQIPWNKTLIYELHIKGLTVRHPDVPQAQQGTYSGLISPEVIEYLHALGITAVELMPVHQFVADRPLVERGLTNYWGYNTIAYLAPHAGYSTEVLGQQVTEFKSMVKAFHRAGIEVLLDVVYNHTGEGNQLGPTLSFRGVGNDTYYWLDPENPRLYTDFTGCGNTVDPRQPRTLQLVLDSLRYWVADMHVDGFRFDIAPVLGRDDQGFN